jgi:hypothetical protein
VCKYPRTNAAPITDNAHLAQHQAQSPDCPGQMEHALCPICLDIEKTTVSEER